MRVMVSPQPSPRSQDSHRPSRTLALRAPPRRFLNTLWISTPVMRRIPGKDRLRTQPGPIRSSSELLLGCTEASGVCKIPQTAQSCSHTAWVCSQFLGRLRAWPFVPAYSVPWQVQTNTKSHIWHCRPCHPFSKNLLVVPITHGMV